MIHSSLVIHAEATMAVLVAHTATKVTPLTIPQFNVRSVPTPMCVVTEKQIFIHLHGHGLTHHQHPRAMVVGMHHPHGQEWGPSQWSTSNWSGGKLCPKLPILASVTESHLHSGY
ncbi:hypothetical protein ACSQ67_004799 [Phaseolus vulgaris]